MGRGIRLGNTAAYGFMERLEALEEAQLVARWTELSPYSFLIEVHVITVIYAMLYLGPYIHSENYVMNFLLLFILPSSLHFHDWFSNVPWLGKRS